MRRFFFLLIMGCFFFSCKKEYSYEGGNPHTDPPPSQQNPSDTYYMDVSLDGGAVNRFKFGVIAQTASNGGTNTLTFQAYAASTGSERVTLTIYYTTVVPTLGDYREDYIGGPDGFAYLITGVYDPPSDPNTAYTAGIGYTASTDPLSITVNGITSTTISGFFSGNFYRTDIVNGVYGMSYNDPIAIQGFFFLPRL